MSAIKNNSLDMTKVKTLLAFLLFEKIFGAFNWFSRVGRLLLCIWVDSRGKGLVILDKCTQLRIPCHLTVVGGLSNI